MTETIYLSVDEKWLNGFDTCLPQNIMQQLNKEMVLKVLRWIIPNTLRRKMQAAEQYV